MQGKQKAAKVQRRSSGSKRKPKETPGTEFLLQLHSLPVASSERELMESARRLLQDYFHPLAIFIAVSDEKEPRRFEVHSQSSLSTADHKKVVTLLEGILASGLDLLRTELFDTLDFLRDMRKDAVLSPPKEVNQILILLVRPEMDSAETSRLLPIVEKELRLRLSLLRSQMQNQLHKSHLSGLHESARGMSRLLFKIDDLLIYMCEEARRGVDAEAVAVLVPTDETKSDYRIHAQIEFPSGVVPLPNTMYAHAFEDFHTNGQKAVVYRAEEKTFFLVPIIQRGEPVSLLLFFSTLPSFTVQEEQYQLAEIFADWLSVAMESSAMFRRVYERENEWENTFDSIADPIYLIDTDFRLKKINKSMADFVIKDIKLPLDRNCYRYLFDQNSVCPWCPVPKVVQTGEAVTVEAPIFHGSLWHIQSFPYLDKSNDRIGSINVLRDMTPLKRVQDQLIESEKLAAAGKLISGVAHEVRNPLFGISATVRALANELKEKKDIQPFLDIITSETTRLNRLMEDLLNYSRPVQIDKDASDIAEIADEVIHHFRQSQVADGAEIEVLSSDRVPPMNVDRNKIKQVLFNLVENSIQHSPEKARIVIFLQYMSLSNPPEVQIVVKDSGIGIDEQNLKRVFDPFFTTRPKGTGLGLSIVRKVIHDHGGRISIESHTGIGTTFRISLPVTFPSL